MKRRKLNDGQSLSHGSFNDYSSLVSSHLDHKSFSTLALDTSNSDIFTLQVNELLAETYYQTLEGSEEAQTLVQRVKSTIVNLPSSDPLPPKQAEHVLRVYSKILVPFPEPRPTEEAKYLMEFAPPTEIQVIDPTFKAPAHVEDGDSTFDMVLMMPLHIFQDKDYINYRYFHKRAYYLACVAAGILNTLADSVSVQFELLEGNRLLPSLLVRSLRDLNAGLKSPSFQVRITTAIPPNLFPLAKTAPMRNCVRANQALNSSHALPSTPFYNSTLRSEASAATYMELLGETSRNVAGFASAVKLMAIWLRQRGFSSSIQAGGFGIFEISVLMALLLRQGNTKGRSTLSASYSHHQLFRATMYFLATRDLSQSPMLLGTELKLEDGVYGHSMPVLFDGPCGLNILFKMTAWSYARLRQEASSTLACLGDSSLNRLRCCFIAKLSFPLLQYDYILRGRLQKPERKARNLIDSRSHLLDVCNEIYTILRRGFDDRIRSINLDVASPNPWSLDEVQPEPEATFKIYLIASPNEMARKIDRGPPAENEKAAEEFRKFWGQRAELRRFRDGSITESVVWSNDGSTTSVVYDIINHLLTRHLGDQLREPIHVVNDGIEQYSPTSDHSQLVSRAAGVWKTFERLKQSINEIDGLPLQIRQFSPASAQLRLTSAGGNGVNTHAVAAADVVLQFESSGRWPDDLAAIQKTKVALLLKLGEILEQMHSDLIAAIGVENQDNLLLNAVFLDIVLEGYKFRLRVHHDREQTLLERQLTSESSLPSEKQAAASAISFYKSRFTNAPLFSKVVRSLCIRYQFLSPTICLLKAWCSRHLLTPHVTEELLELIAISAFTQPLPYMEPGSLRTGFLRSIAKIAHWNWRHEPLFVHMNDTLSAADMDAFQTQLHAWRKIDPAMIRTVFLIGTPLDPTGIAWTQDRPQKVIATRLVALAKATLASATSDINHFNPAPLFTTPKDGYDFLIHVKQESAALRPRKNGAPHNGNVAGRRSDLLTVSNAIRAFVIELESIFGESVLFLYDGLSPAFIVGLWNPTAGPRKWKMNLHISTLVKGGHLDTAKRHVTINKTSILHDIARLGGDLVSRIEVLSDV